MWRWVDVVEVAELKDLAFTAVVSDSASVATIARVIYFQWIACMCQLFLFEAVV